ncbi:MAG: leucine-rich repeat domain-containing protein [Bacteroidia bacterium]|nr:hypothetical protein [Bacteroidia bacterium]MDW8014397.1 leucine-rich repeat domain-containing protein [Bacteroidia bacterium]
MRLRAKLLSLLLSGVILAQKQEGPSRLVVYDALIDRFFHIQSWTASNTSTTRPDTVLYLYAEEELPSLSRFPRLQGLYLSSLSDLNAAELVRQIKRLCPQLRILALEDCDLSDISPLSELSQLQGLLLDGNPIKDFTPLAKLRGLQFLSLARTPLETIDWIVALPTLQGLDLSETKVIHLQPLKSLPNLRMIALYRCHSIADLSPLFSLPQIEFLNVSFMNPQTVQPLLLEIHRFSGLRVLQAQGVVTNATLLKGIEHLSHLEELTLGQNPALNTLAFVRPLQRLLYLDVHHCMVKDLSPLSGLPSLVKLSIGKNQVSHLAPLVSCPRLRELYCYENPIVDWEKLLEMPALTYVMISRRDIPAEKLSTLNAQLRKKGVQLDAP